MGNSIFTAQNAPRDIGGYGYLYNQYAASDANMFPTDWQLPTKTQWQTLISNVTDGGELKEFGFRHWDSPNTGADNSSGFSAFGGSNREADGTFSTLFPFEKYCFFYSSTEELTNSYYSVSLSYNDISINEVSPNENAGLSLRAIYTGAGTPSTVTDNDGNVYDVVLIGSQRWTVQNWKSTTLSKTPFTALTKVTDNTAWAALTAEGYCAINNDDKKV